MKKRRIYLDYASLTPIDPRVIREMKAYSSQTYANPSSLYREGVAAHTALNEGRTRTAAFLHAHPDEILFTSGGTEANGLALEGAGRTAHCSGIKKPHLIVSAVEHSSVLEVADMMERHGTEVTRLGVNEAGIISLDELKRALKPDTFMVSIMTVNNEIGTIQPIREIAKIIRQARERFRGTASGTSASPYPLFHTDAAQAASFMDLNAEKLGVDLLTLDGSKAYGPRGISCLYVKRGTPIEPIMYGGGQESGLRSGTENIPSIMGFAKALDIASSLREKESMRINHLKAGFAADLKAIRPDITVNPSEEEQASGALSKSGKNVATFQKSQNGDAAFATLVQAPHILNVSIPGIDNEFFVLQMDARGIACSTKSSCLRDQDESYVLKAIGVDSKTSVRFSFGRWTKESDIKKALSAVKEVLNK